MLGGSQCHNQFMRALRNVALLIIFTTCYTATLQDNINLSVGVQRPGYKPAADLINAGLGPVHLPVTTNKKLS